MNSSHFASIACSMETRLGSSIIVVTQTSSHSIWQAKAIQTCIILLGSLLKERSCQVKSSLLTTLGIKTCLISAKMYHASVKLRSVEGFWWELRRWRKLLFKRVLLRTWIRSKMNYQTLPSHPRAPRILLALVLVLQLVLPGSLFSNRFLYQRLIQSRRLRVPLLLRNQLQQKVA